MPEQEFAPSRLMTTEPDLLEDAAIRATDVIIQNALQSLKVRVPALFGGLLPDHDQDTKYASAKRMTILNEMCLYNATVQAASGGQASTLFG